MSEEIQVADRVKDWLIKSVKPFTCTEEVSTSSLGLEFRDSRIYIERKDLRRLEFSGSNQVITRFIYIGIKPELAQRLVEDRWLHA